MSALDAKGNDLLAGSVPFSACMRISAYVVSSACLICCVKRITLTYDHSADLHGSSSSSCTGRTVTDPSSFLTVLLARKKPTSNRIAESISEVRLKAFSSTLSSSSVGVPPLDRSCCCKS